MGIRSDYPQLIAVLSRLAGREAAKKLVAYIKLCRPFTGLAPLLAGVLGTLLPVADVAGWLELKVGIYIGVTLMMLQFVGQITNQVSDIEIDKIVKPYRPLPRGEVSTGEAMGLAWILAIFALGRALLVGPVFMLACLIILFFAVTFNVEPIRAKRNVYLSITWMAVSRGLLPFIATWSVFGDLKSPTPWLLGVFAMLWVMALNPVKDFSDIEGDARFGIKTLPVVLGVEKASKVIMALSSTPFIYLALLHVFYPGFGFWLLWCLLALLPAVYVGLRVKTPLENNLSWQCYYVGLALIYILSYLSKCWL